MVACKLMLVFLGFLVAQSLGHIYRLPCKKFAEFSIVEKDSGLNADAVLKTLGNTNKQACRSECIRNSNCKSFSTKLKTCELNSKSTEDSNDNVSLESRPGWTYHSTYFDDTLAGPTCRKKNPCPGRRCIDTCGYPGYHCHGAVYLTSPPEQPCCTTAAPVTKTGTTPTSKPPTVVPTKFVKVKIRSQGYLSRHQPADDGAGGIAFIDVDGNYVSPKKRGYNIVVVDANTGTVEDKESFDTTGNPDAKVNLKQFVDGLSNCKIVLIAIQTEGSRKAAPEVYEALKTLHGSEPFQTQFRGAFAMIGFKGVNKPAWVQQVVQKDVYEDAVIEASIPLGGC